MLVVVVEVVLAVSFEETHDEQDTVPLRFGSVQRATVAGRRGREEDRLEDGGYISIVDGR